MNKKELKLKRKQTKPYIEWLVKLNPSSAADVLEEALHASTVVLPPESTDDAWWEGLFLQIDLGDIVAEVSRNEQPHTVHPQHRRAVQSVAALAIVDVWRLTYLVESLSLRRAYPINLATAMFRYAFNESTPIDGATFAVDSLRPLCQSNVFESALKRAVEEMGVSGIPEDIRAIFDDRTLSEEDLGFGYYRAVSIPSGASDLYFQIELEGRREFFNRTNGWL